MDIPPHLLPMVLCAKCNCFLSRQPVMLLQDDRSVCGSCCDPSLTRNFTYESLVQMMSFPCRYKVQGCKEKLLWNTSAEHEEACSFSPYATVNEVVTSSEKCCNCSKNIYILPRYECQQGHQICSSCITANNFRCSLCKSQIQNEIIYLCKYWTFGCKKKGIKDNIMRHETDCDMRGFNCPFLIDDCKWTGSLYHMRNHLRTSHQEEIIEHEEVTRESRMRDGSWVMLAHDEIFRCFIWVGENDVEWIAKYVGPQERCAKFACEVQLYSNSTKSILKMTNTCHGWNNVALEKCIQLNLYDIDKYINNGRINFKFKILKKNAH